MYDLPKSDEVKIEIYNIRGQLVKELLYGAQSQGEHAIRWDRTEPIRYGKNVSAGIYIIHLKTPTEIFSSKFLALK